MKKILAKFLIFMAAAVSFSSCLEQYPESAIPEDQAITTVAECDQAVIGIYSALKSGALYSGYLTLLPDIQADLVYAVQGYTNTYGDVWRWEILPTNTQIESVYAALYGVIGDCNFFFDYVDRVRANVKTDDEMDELTNLEGEVYFARALAYSELIKLFCKAYDPATADSELGVVLVSSYHNPGTLRRATLKESYDFVISDLEKAVEQIELEDTYNSVYFSKDAANALLARVYLYMQDWDKAIEYSTKLIEDEYLSLASVNTAMTTDYNAYDYMWRLDAAYEIIWKIGFTTTSYGGALGQVFLNYNYVGYYPDYVPAQWVLDLYTSTDLRYDSFFASVTTGYSHGLTWPLLVKYLGNDNFLDQNILFVNMPKVFRLSEQYLIRAEAYCRNGDYVSASRDLSTLRNARFEGSGSITVSENDWLQTISEERVRELYMEGFRLQDLKRWHQGFERKAQDYTIEEGSSLKVEADDPLFVWPIPQHELNSPGAEIEPNESNR